ncbi:hypothetical protein ACVISU_007969 [Bradyrhizobium sp. USDA 4452]
MYPPEATFGLVNLARAGLLRLDQFEVTTFDLGPRQPRRGTRRRQ